MEESGRIEGKSVRVVALADLHCGHIGAVTPPDYWWHTNVRDHKVQAVAEAQREIWAAYVEEVRRIGPPDLLIVNGDLVEGVGRLTGGRELVTTDVEAQCRIAAEVIAVWEPKVVWATYGTAYHVSLEGQDLESFVVELLRRQGFKAFIDSHAFIEVNGIVFDVRHYGGRSFLPYTRATPLAREWLMNQLWAARGEQPQANVFLRAHTHSFSVVGGSRPDFLAFSQPALLAAMTIYGARKGGNLVDWGFLVFDISADGGISWELVTRELRANRREPVSIEEVLYAHQGWGYTENRNDPGCGSAGY